MKIIKVRMLRDVIWSGPLGFCMRSGSAYPIPRCYKETKRGVMFGTFLEGPSGLIKSLFPSPAHKHTPKMDKALFIGMTIA